MSKFLHPIGQLCPAEFPEQSITVFGLEWNLLLQDRLIFRTTTIMILFPSPSQLSRVIFSCSLNNCIIRPPQCWKVLCVHKSGCWLIVYISPQMGVLHIDISLLLPFPSMPRQWAQGTAACPLHSPLWYLPWIFALLQFVVHKIFLAVYSWLILEICFHLPTLIPGAACKLPGTKNQWWQPRSGLGFFINLKLWAAPVWLLLQG